MKTLISLAITLMTGLIASAVWRCPLPYKISSEQTPKFYEGIKNFTFDILRHKMVLNPNGSVLFSPVSLYRTLSVGYVGSHGDSSELFAKKLYLDWSVDKSELVSEYRHVLALQQASAKLEPKILFDTYEVAYFDQVFQVVKCMKQLFFHEVQITDLKDKPEESRIQINSLVEKKTFNQIKNLLPPGSIHDKTDIVIANAAYFKAPWKLSFNEEETVQKEFFKTPTSSVKVNMMKKTEKLLYGFNEKLNAVVVDIPYAKSENNTNEMRFFMILPNEIKENAVEEMIGSITPDGVISNDMKFGVVDLELPRFTLEDTTDLVQMLKLLELEPLMSEAADFSGFTGTQKFILESFYHRAKIEVDEEGSAPLVGITSNFIEDEVSSLVTIHANRPFFFIVLDSLSILMAGIFKGP